MESKKSLAYKIFDFLKSSSIEYVFLRDRLVIDHIISNDDLFDEDIDLYIESARKKEFFDIKKFYLNQAALQIQKNYSFKLIVFLSI